MTLVEKIKDLTTLKFFSKLEIATISTSILSLTGIGFISQPLGSLVYEITSKYPAILFPSETSVALCRQIIERTC